MTEAWLEDLEESACAALLRSATIGRLGIVVDGAPVIFPVNYRVVETDRRPLVAIRARTGGTLDHDGALVAFEIDGIDESHHRGWSILVRGQLRRVDEADIGAEIVDSHPWITTERDAWLVIDITAITGRQLHAASIAWAFHPGAYL
jgi:nitroimidazol reductase NimA-like FMN-containing flavoprotein (pyridoxamine 5'-phosphate oxidase superfamily)